MEKCQPFPWPSGSLPLAEKIFHLIESFLAGTGKLCLFNKNPKLGLHYCLCHGNLKSKDPLTHPDLASVLKKLSVFHGN